MFRSVILPLALLSLARANLTGMFSIPDNCIGNGCTFKIMWSSKPAGMVEFTVHAKVPKGIWAGIGFSMTGEMDGSDAVVGWMPDNNDKNFTLTDRFLFGKSPDQVPIDNDEEDVTLTDFSHEDGMLKYTFRRPIVPQDVAADLPLDEGIYIIYAWGGRGLSAEQITTHTNRGNFGRKVDFVNLSPLPSSFPQTPPTMISSPVTADNQDVMPNLPMLGGGIPDQPGGGNMTDMEEYDMKNLNKPVVTDMPKPDIPDVPKPDVPDMPKPDIPDLPMPNITISTAKTDTPDLPKTDRTDMPMPDITNTDGKEATELQMSKVSGTCMGKVCPPNSQCTMERGIARCYCIPGYPMDEYGNCVGPSGMMPPSVPTGAPAMPTDSSAMPFARSTTGIPPPAPSVQVSADQNVVGDKCSGVRCPENAVCRDGRCFCKPGHRGHSDGTCKSIIPIDKCSAVRCSANEMCADGACVCLPGYSSHSDGTCKLTVADKCSRIRCPANAICRDGSCYCMRGYSSHIDGSCKNKCEGIQCPKHATCRNGACYCMTGYSRHSDGSCHMTSSLGPYCSGRRCPANAECKVGKCYCKMGYVRHSNSCVKWSVLSGCSTLNCGAGTCVVRDGHAGCSFSSRPHPGHSSGSCYGRCGSYHTTHICSCSHDCLRYGGCCRDYNYYCGRHQPYFYRQG